MSLFLSELERGLINETRRTGITSEFYWPLVARAERRASAPGLSDRRTSTDLWHHALEYLSEAAMAHALHPSDALAAWLRETTLSIARRPLKDWVGPGFRNYNPENPVGHLETAHLSMAVASALDLAPEIFTETERDEISDVLLNKGMRLCRNWMDQTGHLNNWRCILLAGFAVPAAVLNRAEDIAFAVREFKRCIDCFQPDGSYGESLQYGNYAMTGLVYTREALTRRDPSLKNKLPLEPYVFSPRWNAASYLYSKPLSGWGSQALPRSVNFNDSAAIYRASGDNLLHIAVRAKDSHPQSAGLARWLFDTHYVNQGDPDPQDLASFGFVNNCGFLTLPLLAQAADPLPPEEAGLRELETFSCGDTIARDHTNGKTVLAAKTGGGPLHAVAHLHGDLNSFILTHNNERLLVDPGHSCYRNLTHGIETSTLTHNTCVFTTDASDGLGLQEDQHKRINLEQSSNIRRLLGENGTNGPTCDRLARRLIAQRDGDFTVIGSEAGKLYGDPILEFSRFWLLCGSHALFVVDRIRASRPVTPSWSWLLNNRDGQLDLKIVHPDRLVARRGNAGMKLFHLGNGTITPPTYGFVHDAYHTLPNELGEGKTGSGYLVHVNSSEAITDSINLHAICLDTPGRIAGWHLKQETGFDAVIEDPSGTRSFKLKIADQLASMSVLDTASGRTLTVTQNADSEWQMETKV